MGFMGFKRFYRSTKIKLTRILNSDLSGHKMDPDVSKIYGIVREMCKSKSTKFLIAPVSHTYYLENKELQYFIVLGDSEIRVTNHKFYITKSLTPGQAYKIIGFVRSHIEMLRKDMEKEIFANESNMINEIYNNLKNLNTK